MTRYRVALAAAAVAAAAATGVVGGVALAGGMALGGSDEKAKLANPPGGPEFAPSDLDNPRRAALKESMERVSAWLDSPAAQALDVRSLPRANMLSLGVGGEQTLGAAVDKADVIAVGEVVEYKFGRWGSSITLHVESTLKGKHASTLVVPLPGGPYPRDREHKDVYLVEAENVPILLPGDRAMLFLDQSAEDGRFDVQPSSGHYRLDKANKVRPLPSNPFAQAVDGMKLADFVRDIRPRVR